MTARLKPFSYGIHTTGEYIGSQYAELSGERALVMVAQQDDPVTSKHVYAQFDKFDLWPWSHNWHKLPREDFVLRHTRWSDFDDAPVEVEIT